MLPAQGPGPENALLLSPGKLIDLSVFVTVHADAGNHFLRDQTVAL